MAKRIAIKNKILDNNKHFWIIKKLKTRGFIAGKYRISNLNNVNYNFNAVEVIRPQLYQKFLNREEYFEADYNIKDELKELLELSAKNHENLIRSHWKNVLPLYPIEPVN